ncbi:hypothetical protein PI124_g5147 [Phytophthora idaei]|nr:hypothetical protein PC122_g2563 [Phytophthora cactorum]KAG3250219.1 hypothetical protein PI124_g5147 [Phytophthora idaei]
MRVRRERNRHQQWMATWYRVAAPSIFSMPMAICSELGSTKMPQSPERYQTPVDRPEIQGPKAKTDLLDITIEKTSVNPDIPR